MERKIFQRRLQRAVDNYGGDIFSWQAMLTLQGARFPEAGDSFNYPVASSLEFIRQGLLTYNTYISALTLPPSSIPALAPTTAISTTAPPPSRRFYVGQVHHACPCSCSSGSTLWTPWRNGSKPPSSPSTPTSSSSTTTAGPRVGTSGSTSYLRFSVST